MGKEQIRKPSFVLSLAAIGLLVLFVGVGYLAFGLKVDVMLIIATIGVGIMALTLGYRYTDMEKFITTRMSKTIPTLCIIWSIGAVIGTFMFSGSIPMMIYYGIKLIDPKLVVVSAFLVAAIFSTVTGTSWGSAGTAGVAFMGIASSLQVPLPMVAGAVICGATFGDKLSPLSDTTNLAPVCAGTTLYKHIQSMLWTAVPASIIAALVFLIAGNSLHITGSALVGDALEMTTTLDTMFKWSFWQVLPFLVIVGGALLKQPPVPTMLAGSFIAMLIGVVHQGFSVSDGVLAMYSGFKMNMVTTAGFDPSSASAMVTTLAVRGGMTSMVSIVVIIFCGYAYTSILSGAGFLDRALEPLTTRISGRIPVMIVSFITGFILLALSGITYTTSICLPDMFKRSFLKNGMPAQVLSRTIEDSSTIMAPLIPWGTSGILYATTLGVSTYGAGGYAPWVITAFVTPIIGLILAATGIGIYKMNDAQIEEALAEYDAEQERIKLSV